MIKDTFFSLPRFMNLCRKEMAENWKANVLRIVLMYGVMVLLLIGVDYLIYKSDQGYFYHSLWLVFVLCLLGFGCFSVSLTMNNMKSKTSRLAVLMTPVTPFEHILFRLLVSTVVFLVVFLIAFELAACTRVLLYSIIGSGLKDSSFSLESIGVWRNMSLWVDILLVHSFIQSLFVLGSTVWQKNAFLKAFAFTAVIVFIYWTVIISASSMIFKDSDKDYSHIPGILSFFLFDVPFLLFILGNWALAYFRFKETDIIQR